MKSVLLQSATLISPGSPFNGKIVDILIRDGKIAALDTRLDVPESTELINAKGKFVSPGFFDLNANFGDPGLETKEDMESGSLAASAGGFTGLVLMPNTQPPIHSKAEVSYIKNKSEGNLVDIFPLGTISHKREGKDLAELYDMSLAGAIAFTDGNRPVADPGLMSRAMQYVKGFDGLVFSYAEDPSLAGSGKINEGAVSTYLGIKGIPSLAEEIMVLRDIYLAEYNDTRIHFSTISTAHSVELIRQAKKRGIKVSCDITAHHLHLTEDLLEGFDSNYKVKPPLRTKKDRDALIEGLKDGTINAIVSQHTPHEIECKDIEFESASYGITGLQTVLPLVIAAGLSVEQCVDKLAIQPRKLVGLPVPPVQTGEPANLVLFDTNTIWKLDKVNNFSKSSNTPLMGQELCGKVWMIFNNKQWADFRN